jgi:uncharacterized surface protein with fasciclin (FAS1) repeats
MTKKWITAALAAGTTAAVALGVTAPAAVAASGGASTTAAAHRSSGTDSLAQLLAADGHGFDHRWGDFDVLDRVVGTVLTAKPDSPVAVLADGRTRLTAFLPTDRAFRKLARALTGHRPATERGVYRALASTADVDTLETVLLYHVVPGATLPARKVLMSDGARLTTAQGGRVTVHVRGHRITLADRDPGARDARVNLWQTDLNAGNRQIAHGVNRVLRPVDL